MSADPEIKLPPEPDDLKNKSSNPDLKQDEREKRPDSDSWSGDRPTVRLSANDEITWHYLTFETETPSPAYLATSASSDDSRAPPPECPNLKKYQSPFDWSPKRKAILTWISVTATMFTAYTAGSYSAGTDQMTELWGISDVAAETGITIFTCGFAIAPMVLAPFSEINGRRPMFVVTGILFVVFQVVCAVTPTFAGMLVARFLVGCAGSSFSTMVGGVVSDIYRAENRNTAMALFAGAALVGTGLGPLISGFIAYNTTWRWIFYLQVIVDGIVMVFIVFFFKETRGSVLLSRKAKALNKWYDSLEGHGYYGMMMPTQDPTKTVPQRIRWKVKSDEERASLGKMITVSLYRPFHLLFTEPVVFFFSLWISFSWAILYLMFSAIPLVFRANYDFNLQEADAIFTAISVGAMISTVISIYQEKLARRFASDKRRGFLNSPEGRLYFSCIQSALLPIGCFWFGWTQFSYIHWIVPALAVGCATMGIFSIYLAVFNYLADTYHKYASSALAAQSFCRNALAGAFPLFTRQMFNAMTYQGAGSFLGGFAALLTVVPWILVFFGPKIRARSKLASEILKDN
ncbi:MFS general substrate transporter [Hortaea werneckii]|nr:MFS general substrate transporter [Hortaea werneckii]KAI7070643.1 MFS general substrate transporter [Hortaea werneckii]KAI7244927.1 MFS general substrate transporter [Hortaea werneckii]KAI7300969.1 MFS general substrate transporter [Hortaea werneckii]KAI7380419.1 MFS general substrate transporter [Hortaea werneckii]